MCPDRGRTAKLSLINHSMEALASRRMLGDLKDLSF